MHYYLLHTEIRDSDNEYDEWSVIETDKTMNETTIFKRFIDENYGKGKEKLDSDTYELPQDYRIISFAGVRKISKWMIKKLHDYGIAYSISI